EAKRTLDIAREKGEALVDRDSVVQAAKVRAEQLIAQTKLEGEATKREADEYVLQTLTKLEIELDRSMTQVRNGIRALQRE
ncbi:MAG: hypothetical protein U1B80_06995, partial [Anaerolineaceae bacterium]|nr:hypothetical protein [Anaerolineaceae bacterium]